ncbi:RDD family protein [Streptomyces sulfonofaciens]|nr:RDD family protein [Streptomyces sulfonofaciens]
MPPLAPSGRRVLARVIDIVVVGVVVWLVSLALGVAAYEINDRMQFGRSFGESLITAVFYIAYDAILISRTGQTLGKRLLKLRVANLSDGSTPTFQVSLARAAVLWVPFAFCCAFVWTAVSGGWSFFDRPYKQGLHDKAARTVVVSIV